MMQLLEFFFALNNLLKTNYRRETKEKQQEAVRFLFQKAIFHQFYPLWKSQRNQFRFVVKTNNQMDWFVLRPSEVACSTG